MGFLGVLVAAIGGWLFGAVWYMALSKPWMEASGVPVGEDGKPVNSSSPIPYVISLICIVIVAGMMRHSFATAGIDTFGKGLVSGLGIGLFFITPWIVLNNAYSTKPFRLALIDGGYATFGCAVIGAILVLV